jgi:hypothetical protein
MNEQDYNEYDWNCFPFNFHLLLKGGGNPLLLFRERSRPQALFSRDRFLTFY